MRTWADEQLDQLRHTYPGWDFWTVPLSLVRRTVWCARPSGHPVATINTWSPEDLAERIEQASSPEGRAAHEAAR